MRTCFTTGSFRLALKERIDPPVLELTRCKVHNLVQLALARQSEHVQRHEAVIVAFEAPRFRLAPKEEF